MSKMMAVAYITVLCLFLHSGLLFLLECPEAGTLGEICKSSISGISSLFLFVDVAPAMMQNLSMFFFRVEMAMAGLFILDLFFAMAPSILRLSIISMFLFPLFSSFESLLSLAKTIL